MHQRAAAVGGPKNSMNQRTAQMESSLDTQKKQIDFQAALWLFPVKHLTESRPVNQVLRTQEHGFKGLFCSCGCADMSEWR